MPIDFAQYRSSRTVGPSHPRDIFASLSRRTSGFGYLRDVQGQVIDRWYDRRTDRDIVIKMNTGTGKTIVGLLLLLSSIREQHEPALYVAPDKFLARQVADQAESLGIDWTDDPESPSYLNGDAIGIVNIYRLVNGRSIFGGPGSRRTSPIPIGSLVIDDAHACVSTIEDTTTLSVPRDHPAYDAMLKLFHVDLLGQSANHVMDLKDKNSNVVVRVPISAWAAKATDVIAGLHDYQDESPFTFSWPFVRDILLSCEATFSSRSFEIRPLCPPTNRIVSFEDARRRLYLTATLPDDSILITHFGASEEAARSPVTPTSAADIGDRLILPPLHLNPIAGDVLIRQWIKSFARSVNVVVLVPSYRRAEKWSDYADETVSADTLAEAVASLRSRHVGLVVFVNKYDGVDLPDGACRLLVIDGVPEAIGNSKRREAEILGGSDTLAYRTLQRIEQGMGRGVRSTEDYCVVLLLGTSLTTVVAQSQMRDRLSPATRAQLELSMAIARDIEGTGLRELRAVIQQCLDRDQGWLAASRDCLAGVNYEEASVEDFAIPLRLAFEAASSGQYADATNVLSNAINLVSDARTRGWLQEQLATYMHPMDPNRAQNILASAVRHNPRVMRPLAGVAYRRVPATVNQASAVMTEIESRFTTPNDLALGFRYIVDRLGFGTSAASFEDAMEELGRMIGFGSQRPERDTGRGPDALWGLGELRFLVIECKSEAESDVWKRDAGQLAHSMNWFWDNYDNTCSPTPLLVHHSGRHAEDASPPLDARLIDSDRMARLHDSLMKFAEAAASRWPLSVEDVKELLSHHGLTPSDFVARYTRRLT